MNHPISANGAMGGFTQDGATFSGFSSIVLGEKGHQLQDLDAAEVNLSIECDGHGLTGDVARTLLLDIPN